MSCIARDLAGINNERLAITKYDMSFVEGLNDFKPLAYFDKTVVIP